MATYYCDPSLDFAAGRDGTDHAGEELAGVGGLQIAIRGGGGAAGEFKAGGLVAGDILYLKASTGYVSRLVKIDCDGHDCSAWEIGDSVETAPNGAVLWTGKVVQERDNVATGLTADDICLVQLDDPYDYDTVNDNQARGIRNTTKAENADIADVTCVGSEIDTNSGDAVTGHIRVIGVDNAWNIANPDAGDDTSYQAILDGAGKATNCLKVFAKHRLHIENLTLQNASGDGFTTDGNNFQYWRFKHCISNSHGGSGWSLINDSQYTMFLRCIARGNGASGFFYPQDCNRFVNCVASGNTNNGFGQIKTRHVLYGCVSYENGDDGFATGDNHNTFINCVSDGSTGDSGIFFSGADVGHCVYNCRLTNNAAYGIEQGDGATEESSYEDFNVFDSNNGGGAGLDLLNITSGFRSYGGGANHIADPADDGYDAAADHYEVTAGKEYSARNAADECVLNWDGVPAANNSVWVTAGLPIEAPAGGSGGIAHLAGDGGGLIG